MNEKQARTIVSPMPYISAQGLDVGYQTGPVVTDINFTLGKGESLALVGVNGSGKSTLLKTLVGLLPASKGDLCVLENTPGKVPRQIAYLSQFHSSGFILPLRAVDVVRMGRFANHGLLGRMTSEDEDIIHQSMHRMDISQLADQPVRALSGGQQQRVYIAQTLARRADLLILDEPTSGLDAGGKEIYQIAIDEELSRCASVVVATHDIQEAMNCDWAMLLARKVVAFGRGRDIITPQALIETFGILVTLDKQDIGVTVIEREHGHGCSG